MEIERKFLLKSLPDNIEQYTNSLLEQAYISTAPVIRIRQKSSSSSTKYILTVKSSGLLTRQEFEMELTKEEYNNLCKKVCGNIITKTRYIIPQDNNLILELDIFHGVFEGLIMGEIEFESEEAAKKYTPSEIFSEEVTYDTRFHNSSMSNMTSEQISSFILSLSSKN